MSSPRQTVLLSVRNGERYLEEALHSLENQTRTADEILVTDDASTDGTAMILARHASDRFKITTNTEPHGLARNLNAMAKQAHGDLLARMDADDVSESGRFAVQAAFLEAHPDVGAVGGQAIMIDEDGRATKPYRVFTDHLLIKFRALFANPLVHPTVMIRKEVLLAHPYDETYENSQDYELWSRLLFDHGVRFANVKETVLRYRVHKESTTATREPARKERPIQTSLHNIKRYIDLKENEERLLVAFKHLEPLTVSDLTRLALLFFRIRRAFIKKSRPSFWQRLCVMHETKRMCLKLFPYWLKTRR